MTNTSLARFLYLLCLPMQAANVNACIGRHLYTRVHGAARRPLHHTSLFFPLFQRPVATTMFLRGKMEERGGTAKRR